MSGQAMIQAAVEQSLVAAAKQVEEQLDSQLQALDNVDADDIEALRQRRLQHMKRMAAKKQEWLRAGHGEYRELPGEKEFFAEIKGEARVVCHFYRENWPCKVMDKHLQKLAASHLETKFLKINAEKSPFLVERLRIFMLPTLALIKEEKTTDYVVGFDELGGTDAFPTQVLTDRLVRSGLLHEEGVAGRTQARESRIRRGGTAGDSGDESD